MLDSVAGRVEARQVGGETRSERELQEGLEEIRLGAEEVIEAARRERAPNTQVQGCEESELVTAEELEALEELEGRGRDAHGRDGAPHGPVRPLGDVVAAGSAPGTVRADEKETP